MNKVEMRDALVAHLEDNFGHPEIVRFYDNPGEVDLDNVGETFLRVEINFYGARQANIAQYPFFRTYGSITIMLYSKIGTGVRDRLILLDELTELFKFKVLGGLHLQVPTPGRYKESDGWHSAALAVPFFADSNA